MNTDIYNVLTHRPIETCKYCKVQFPGNREFGDCAEKFGIVGSELVSIHPICKKCFRKYRRVRKNYNNDHNLNSICMWIRFNSIQESICEFDEYPRFFFFSFGHKNFFIQLPKIEAGGFAIPTGFMFNKLDEIKHNYESSLKKIPVMA